MKNYRKTPPRTTKTGCVLVGFQSILYDIFLHYEEVGHFPTISDIEAMSPSSARNKYTLSTLKKMQADGVIEVHPKYMFTWPRRYRIADGSRQSLPARLTPSGIVVKGNDLRWYLLVEGFEEIYGHPPHIIDLVKASGCTRQYVRLTLRRMARWGVLYWKDNKHIGVRRRD